MNLTYLEKQLSLLLKDYTSVADRTYLKSLINAYSEIARLYDDEDEKAFLNQVIASNYCNEAIVKYALCNHFRRRKQNANETVIFECPAGSSRLDLCRINGKSYAYEIKTKYDSYNRLNKQLYDYKLLFDYVYLVLPSENYREIPTNLPDFAGIVTYTNHSGSLSFSFRRKPLKCAPETISQISALPIDALHLLSDYLHTERLSNKKEYMAHAIAYKNQFDCRQINQGFKNVLKQLYGKRWDYLHAHYERVSPLDAQFVFSKSILPCL